MTEIFPIIFIYLILIFILVMIGFIAYSLIQRNKKTQELNLKEKEKIYKEIKEIQKKLSKLDN